MRSEKQQSQKIPCKGIIVKSLESFQQKCNMLSLKLRSCDAVVLWINREIGARIKNKNLSGGYYSNLDEKWWWCEPERKTQRWGCTAHSGHSLQAAWTRCPNGLDVTWGANKEIKDDSNILTYTVKINKLLIIENGETRGVGCKGWDARSSIWGIFEVISLSQWRVWLCG